MSAPLVVSVFPGIGLLDMAFEEAGFCVVRGPDLLWGGDVRRFHSPAGRFDGVIGGPPCQSFTPLVHLNAAIGAKPEHGDLIPEFERVISEAEPQWFVMEQVRQARLPAVAGYAVHAQLLNNRWLGEDQNRVRRFSFGVRAAQAVPLRVQLAALDSITWKAAVTSAHGGERRSHVSSKTGGRIQRYTVEEALKEQGLPADFFAHSPFRRDRQLKAIANGVPLAMGRAIAKAVRVAMYPDWREGAA